MLYFLKKSIPQSYKNIYHLTQAILSCFWFGFPAKKIKIIGVTGTDGKTTTANIIERVLSEAGHSVALASTINFRIAGEETINKTKYTTLSPFFIQGFLQKAVQRGCKYAILEVSSHALDQNRLWGIYFDIAVLTNITREHLDYHKTMKQYRKAKRKLFEKADTIIIPEKLPSYQEFLSVSAKRKILYGFSSTRKEKDTEYFCAENVQVMLCGSRFTFDKQEFSLSLPGRFNIENVLASLIIAHIIGIDAKIGREALSKIQTIPGRMENIPNKREITIIIDYAVTPEALKTIYTFISETKKDGKIIAVFGACGDRDRGKRSLMGEIVDRYTNTIILTNEDPYWENPERILDEIEKGIRKKEKNVEYFRIFDRREALKKALLIAQKGDIVVVTGKGAEETMAIRNKRLPWNDKKVIKEILKEL
ncbi:MAG: UDP-N-acetylmuramoyl-L-alanyl-D-glutamate--2,6-diaminopimelate ligase [Candidatus Moranbacteria bacterium]|nr:UDP-N-acetylmuramoyl-L-alanyl-D-glutamate--2,6-diaminopimelate ligase [Candidatus Moranbacteria bacterium]